MDYTYDFTKNIPLASGFGVGVGKPLDLRTVVNTIAQRDAHVTEGRAYPGLIVYVTSEAKFYVYDGSDWSTLVASSEGGATLPEITGRVETLEASKATQATKISALENTVGTAATDAVGTEGEEGYVPAQPATGLVKSVADNASAIASKADASDLEALEGRVDTLEGASHEHANKAELDLIESGDVAKWNAKYDKPADGIGADDLSEAVKASLALADSALQEHQDISGKADASDLEALEGRVDTLVGEDADKSVRDIAAEEVAKVVADADESFDTLKEIADWITSDTTGAASMANSISALETAVGHSATDAVGTEGEEGYKPATAATGLVKDVADNASAIESLEGVVGDAESGLVKGVADNASAIEALETTVGDAENGLVKDVAANASAIGELQTALADAGKVDDVQIKTTADGEYTTVLSEKVAKIDLSAYAKTADLEATDVIEDSVIESIVACTFEG